MAKKIFLKRNEEERINSGHLWVFSNEIREIQGTPLKGDIIDIYDNLGRFLGKGFYNPNSLIAGRLITKKSEDIDKAFWAEKLLQALKYRNKTYPKLKSFRAVYGESDGIPGLIVDKYEDYLAVQFLSAGLETEKSNIIEAVKDVFNPKGIIARNDSSLRKLEGLEEKNEILFGDIPEKIKIEENGNYFWADLLKGQKTGFFFDQKDNRVLFSKYCTDKKVLDAFCHTGSFGVYAAKFGAKDVVWLDSSRPALEIAEENAKLNGLGNKFNGIVADTLEYLSDTQAQKENFEVINVDPPGLIKSRKDFNAGYKMYVKINSAAINLLPSGGILATSSCSHNLGSSDFRKMLAESAGKSGKQVRLLESGTQSKDHPILVSMPETEYLKFAILEVV